MVLSFTGRARYSGRGSLSLIRVNLPLALSCLALTSLTSPAAAQTPALPDLVITATRTALEPARAGSSITIIKSEEIAKTGSSGVVDVLRGLAGLDIQQTGGVGASTSVSLRGAYDGQTLVMIDGIRIGDPSSTAGQADLGQITTNDIARIEVLRGPQSALYGSDALGGVINIITKTGKRETKREVLLEAGSYGTLHSRGSISGGDDKLSYAFSIDALHSDGFARFGYRIDRPIVLNFGALPLPPLPRTDPVDRGGVTGRVTYAVNEDLRIDTGIAAYGDWLRLVNPGATMAPSVFDSYNQGRSTLLQAHTRITLDSFDGKLRNTVTLFGTLSDNATRERELCFDASFLQFDCRQTFRGSRVGAEYQGDLKLGTFGLLTFGVSDQVETARTTQNPDPQDGSFVPVNAHQTTQAAFIQHQITLWNRLDLSLGGRVDSVIGGKTFSTYRATAAYRIEETGTKFHASVGTGARTPSLFQRFSQYGTAALLPEQNVGYDAGVDQKLFDGRLTLGATAFFNKFQNLIGFANVPSCTPGQQIQGGCYYNVNRALTKGVELSGDAIIVPDAWKARATYTYMIARQLEPGSDLPRRPRNKASASLVFSGVPNLELEARATYVGRRTDFDFYTANGVTAKVQLAPYTKIDAFASYKVNDTTSVFARIENLTDVRYEDVLDYGTAGRAFYAGLKVSW